ncbi:MAG TPA: hypothetical protein VH934_23730 [Xanthobacteraceae bacterium]|jgi:hypothetical protein
MGDNLAPIGLSRVAGSIAPDFDSAEQIRSCGVLAATHSWHGLPLFKQAGFSLSQLTKSSFDFARQLL